MPALSSDPIVVVEEAPSGLTRERWVFSLVGTKLILDRYHHERRFTATGVFKTTKFFDREHDGEEYGDWQWLTAEEVPWDEDLETAARTELAARVTVVILSRRIEP
jgi:hypothetical protein